MKRRKGRFAYKTNIGRVRLTNEDQAAALANSAGDVLLLVCDGMGGQNKGDYASKIAADLICTSFKNKQGFLNIQTAKLWLHTLIRKANSEIFNEANKNAAYKEMGTTLVCALIRGDKVLVANVGDSRAYSVRFESLMPLTQDQTYVDFLFRTGKITQEEMKTHPKRHVLMNALGVFPSVNCDISIKEYIGEPIMLCSDGVYNNISENEIHAVLTTDDRIEQKIDTIIDIANSNGGSDNMSIAYWEAESND